MHTHREILLVLVLFIIELACNSMATTRFVEMPKDWQPVENETVRNGNDTQKLLFVAQHDAAEVENLKGMVDEVSDPNSEKYGHFMSYDKIYRSVLGKTTANGHILEKWAITNGLNVTGTTKNKQFITVEASLDEIERVFKTKLQQYEHMKTGTTVWRGTNFELPSDIDSRVAVISGLDRFPIMHEKKPKTKVFDTAKVIPNAPIILAVDSEFEHYHFFIQLVCPDGEKVSQSLCANQFRGFQIHLSNVAKTFNVPADQANCQVCSNASNITQTFCAGAGLNQTDVLCIFFLEQDGFVPLYQPHTFTVRTKFFPNQLSAAATDGSPLEKVFDMIPPTLRRLYNVNDSPHSRRDKRSRQAVAEFQEFLNIKSFNTFAKIFGRKFPLVFGKVYGGDFNNSANDQFENSLDLQYMAAMGSGIPTDYISPVPMIDGFLLDWFVLLFSIIENKTNVVPLIHSISFGVDENLVGPPYINAAEPQFAILSLLGLTVFVSSGDEGVANNEGICQNTNSPSYPATSAYVTSVGGTQFVQATGDSSRELDGICLEEIVGFRDPLTGCLFTSGGGFSLFIDSPKYQRRAVNTYLRKANNLLPPDTFFNRSNRAFPDISLSGHPYEIIVFGNSFASVDGTSASAPSVAGMFSLINDERLKLGMPPLGLLNPRLYALSKNNPEVFFDITKGNNSCTAGPVCCQFGFVAAKHWDPVTGFGSINQDMLMKRLTEY